MSSDQDLLAEIDQALLNPGRIVIGPTSALTGAYPYGGQGFGLIEDPAWDPGVQETHVVGQSIGQTRKVIRHGERAMFLFTLRGWNGKLLQSFVTNMDTVGQGYAQTFRYLGGNAPGVVPALPKTVFAPLDRAGRAVLFRRPVPLMGLARRVACSIRDPSLFVLAFVATRASTDTSSKRHMQVGRLEDLDL